ncbi:ATP-dependent RNA helicase-like protein DB10 [Cocos nucifera]|uniref:RNA helicase n=1 Tax=Cocos nucifera TaxID=13894 RepID=A0A8K0N329_COCNU|nr:ATP-dependent RNA helicase-like protein DB10 [Cocos nucifera]
MTASASALSGGPRYAPEDPTLPKPWMGLVDGSTGYLYYWNPETNVTQYERPVAEFPPPPLLLPSPPAHRHPKSASVAVSSTVLQSHNQKQREWERDSHEDDGRHGRSRSSHQHGGGRGSSSDNHGYGAGDSRDSRMASARGHGPSSDGGGSLSVEAYRCQHEIIVTGDDVPAPYMTFETAGFPPEILKEIHNAGFSVPTPIQAQSWPIALQSRDIVATAKTGSGKTLGYLIPGFMHLKRLSNNSKMGPTVLVLAPTRELATQIQDEAVKFGRSSRISCTMIFHICIILNKSVIFLGSSLRDLDRGVDVVVATPGRLNDILEMRRVSLRQVSYLVLDEADRMLDMGFEPQITKIVKEIPHRRQTLMFTATWPKEVRKIAADLLVHPVQVNIGSIDDLVANNAITQYVEVITPMEKLRRLEQILRSQDPGSKIIIFCSTKRMCDQLAGTLTRQFGAAAIHGDKSQGERDRVLNQFRTGRSPILVATDVAARGLDIKDIRVVINYDFPTGVEDYVHRIGRTGRAGATGVSYTFFCDQNSKYAADLVRVLEGADQHVPKELRDMVSHGGYGGKSRRWGSRSGARDGGCLHGRSDTSYSGRGGHGLLPSGRADSGRGGRGHDDLEPHHDRYGRGYQDGHEVDIRDRKSRGKRRSCSHSRSWSNSRGYSPNGAKRCVGWGNSCSRSWNHGHNRSRSHSRSTSCGIDQYGDQDGEGAGQRHRESPPSRRRVISPTNHEIGNLVHSSKMPSYKDQRGSPPYNGEGMERVQPDRSASIQKERSECLYGNMDNGKLGISASPAQWHRGSPREYADAEGPNEGPVQSLSVPCDRSGEEEEEGMIPADG